MVSTTLIKLRQLDETIAQPIPAQVGIAFDDQTTQTDLLYRITRELRLEPVVRKMQDLAAGCSGFEKSVCG